MAKSGGSSAGGARKAKPKVEKGPTPMQLQAQKQLASLGDLKAKLEIVAQNRAAPCAVIKPKKGKRGKAFPKPPRISPLQSAAESRRQRIDDLYQIIHPDRAEAERELSARHSRAGNLFGHRRHGTVETHLAAAEEEAVTRQGALARLHRSGAISNDQLGWALEIQAEHERIDAAVGFRGASMETRVDISCDFDTTVFESLGRVRRAMAYTRWRSNLPTICGPCLTGAQHVLEMVVADLGVTWAARRLRMSVRTTRKVLLDALDLWPTMLERVRAEVDEQDLILAHRRIGL